MNKPSRYGYSSQKPIRKDRVVIALLVVAAIIVIPLLLRSGCTRRDPGDLTILSDDQVTAGSATAAGPSDVDSVIDQILSPGGTSAASAGTTPSPSTTGSASNVVPSQVLSHTVKDGETVASVAGSLGVSVRDLRASNGLYESQSIQPGRVLYASRDGILHTIKQGQTLTDISLTYAIPVQTLTAANGLTTASTIYAGSRILIPGGTSALWDTVNELSRGSVSQFIWPLDGEVVSEFGWRTHPVLNTRHHHDGIDIDVPEGTVVHSAAGGKVYFYGEQPGYGNVLIVAHASNYYTLYGHLTSSFVYVGQYVEASQRIALSGNTGISSGPHLHFEIRNGEFPVDPRRYLP